MASKMQKIIKKEVYCAIEQNPNYFTKRENFLAFCNAMKKKHSYKIDSIKYNVTKFISENSNSTPVKKNNNVKKTVAENSKIEIDKPEKIKTATEQQKILNNIKKEFLDENNINTETESDNIDNVENDNIDIETQEKKENIRMEKTTKKYDNMDIIFLCEILLGALFGADIVFSDDEKHILDVAAPDDIEKYVPKKDYVFFALLGTFTLRHLGISFKKFFGIKTKDEAKQQTQTQASEQTNEQKNKNDYINKFIIPEEKNEK